MFWPGYKQNVYFFHFFFFYTNKYYKPADLAPTHMSKKH